MAINVASLPKYVEENTDLLLGKAILGARTIKYMNLQTGVKTEEAINLLKSTIKLADGNKCGFKAEGDDTFSQRIIKTGQIKVNKSYCRESLLGKWTQHDIAISAGRENLPFEEKFMEGNNIAIDEVIEKAIWQGDTLKGASDNLGHFDGLLKILGDAEEVIPVEGAHAETKFDIVAKTLLAIPSKALQGAVIFCAPSFLRAYNQELVAKNLYHHEAGLDYNEEMIPGSQVKLVAVEGLEGTETSDYLVAGQPENFYYGCDLENSKEEYKLWFSDDADEFRYKVRFNAGVQVALPDEIVVTTIARA